MKNVKSNALIAGVILLVYFILGLWVTPDYGFSIDEAVQRDHGLVAMHHLSNVTGIELACIEGQKEVDFHSYAQRYYGNLFQMVAIGFECFLDLEDWRSRYLLRHYLVFILFFCSSLALWKILSSISKDTWLPIICLLVYLTHPRIFAHAHYNPKDLVLLSTYTIALYSLYKLYTQSNTKWLFIHALVCAIVINVRIVGVILIPVTLLLVFWEQRKNFKSLFITSVSFLLSVCIFGILLWPLLWDTPLSNFIWAFKSMSQFPWLKDLIFWGNAVPSVDAPGTYLFSWIGITTPIGYLLGIIVGLCSCLYFWAKDKWVSSYNLAVLPLCSGPIIAVLIFDSILYGGWRHLYFIYSGLIIIAALGLERLRLDLSKYYKVLFGLLILQIGLTSYWLVKNHPYQYAYFNILANNELGMHEQDYWGLSYKNAMEILVDNHLSSEEKVIIASPDFAAYGGYNLLDDRYKKQLEFSWTSEEADYYVSNYRNLDDIAAYKRRVAPYQNEVFQIKVDGVPIVGIYSVSVKQ